MQTFLCEPTFGLSLAHLDTKRLGKQRIEAYQILLALGDEWAWSVYTGTKTPETYGWKNHPAVLMWKNNIHWLHVYYEQTLTYWVERDYRNNMPFFDVLQYLGRDDISKDYPSWYTLEFITSHRCKLLQKNYEFYSQYNWDVPDNWSEIGYIWPVRKLNENS